TEFEHSLDAQQGMADLRNALLSAGSSGDPASASVPLGTTYEQRTFLINPPPARGAVRTAGTGDPRMNVTLDNAVADSPYENAQDYWDGDAHTYDTGAIVYTPNYNEYREAPVTLYEHSLVANVYKENRTLERTGQTLIRGNRINLLTINGTLQENSITGESVDARPLSAYTNTVTVRSDAAEPLWLNVTTRLSSDTWRNRVLAEQLTSNGGSVAEVREISNTTRNGVSYYRVGIRLEAGKSYELRGASVAVGAVSEANKQPKPTYLVVTDGYDTVANGSTGKITVQVRDQFNNPVDGFAVNGSLDTEHLQFVDESATQVDSISVTTDEDGYATLTYTAVKETAGSETAWLNVSMLSGAETYRYTNFSGKQVPLFASGPDGSDIGNTFNPGQPGSVILDDTVRNGDDYTVTFNNTGAENRTIEYARVNVYITQQQGGGTTDEPTYADLFTPSGMQAARLNIGGQYRQLAPTVTIPGDDTRDVTLAFDQTPTNDNDDSWFVITIVYDNGEQALYFVSVAS
ncbi:MAG: hypothetical protein V5A49_07485, partial [Haloarcula sp.]